MKQLIYILSFFLGLTTTVQANKLWECDVVIDGKITSDLIRYTSKVVEIWEDGEVYEYFCKSDVERKNDVTKEACIRKDEDVYTIAIFDLVEGGPSSFSTYDLYTDGEKYKNYEPVFTDKLINCKVY
jgi:hypothetical protein